MVKEINFFKNPKIIFIKENILPSSLTLSHGVTQMMRFIHDFSYYNLQHKSFYLWYAASISAFSKPKFSVCATIEALDKKNPLLPCMENSKWSYPPITGISKIHPHVFPCSSPTLCYLTRLSNLASSLKLLRNITGNRKVKKPHSKSHTLQIHTGGLRQMVTS